MSAQPRDEYRADALAGTHGSADGASGHFDHDFHLAPQLVEVICECGHSNCTGEITISLRAFKAVRRDETRILIKEGHQVPDAARVVGHGTGYVVVATYERDVSSVRDAL